MKRVCFCFIFFVILSIVSTSYGAPRPSEMVEPRTTPKANSEISSKSKRSSITWHPQIFKDTKSITTVETSVVNIIPAKPTEPSPTLKFQEQQTPESPGNKDNKQIKSVAVEGKSSLASPESLQEIARTPPPGASRSGGDKSGISQMVSSSAVQVNQFVGSASFSYPIVLPPGRGGMQPELALSYSSTNRQYGIAGVGWSIELGAIQLSTKRGVPRYDGTDVVTIIMGDSSQELLYDAVAGFYRAEIEGDFIRVKKFTDYWEATDKKGTKYYYGSSKSTRQYDSDNNSHIFHWALEKIEDLNGNYMTFDYLKDGGYLYPEYIYYTKHNKLDKSSFVEVRFYYENTYGRARSYISGFRVRQEKRLKSIVSKVGVNWQTYYKFKYITSQSSKRDLLQSIERFSPDGLQSLPATTFSYNDSQQVKFQMDPAFSISNLPDMTLHNGHWADLGVRVGDLNGDGYADLVRYSAPIDGTTSNQAFINTKQKSWELSGDWKLSMSVIPNMPEGFVAYSSDLDKYTGVNFMDVDGDGISDTLQNFKRDVYWGGGGYYLKSAGINDGKKTFNQDPSWILPNEAILYYETGQTDNPKTFFGSTFFEDVNGDGLPDAMIVRNDPYANKLVYLNNKGTDPRARGWSYTNRWIIPSMEGDFSQGSGMVDLNGDGLSDIVHIVPGDVWIKINNGHGWETDTYGTWKSNMPSNADLRNGSTFFSDVNGDGLNDLIVGNTVHYNTGHSFFNAGISLPSSVDFTDHSTVLMDADGDGMMDLFKSVESQARELYINQAEPADLLVGINNGMGARSNIAYEASTHFSNTLLPYAFPVVKSITVTVDNPIGTAFSYVTSYEYAGGKWEGAYREFLGFQTVKSVDSIGNYVKSTFLQDHWLKGRLVSEEHYDASGHLYAKTVNQWMTQTLAQTDLSYQTSKFVYLSRSDNFIYEKTGTPKRAAQSFIYNENPQYGNITQAINWGEVDFTTGADIAQDKVSSFSEYVYNSALWLVSAPKHTFIKDSQDKIVAQNWFYYDGAASLDAAPLSGKLTKKVDWQGIIGMSDPQTSFTYDGYGNVLTITDPNGNVSKISYDSTYHLFPLVTTNALNQSETVSYYGVDGKLLDEGTGLRGRWGQKRSVTDVNNKTGYIIYDLFGRMTSSVSPIDSVALPTIQKVYEIFPSYVSVLIKSRIESDQPQTRDAIEFYDGLGRLIQTKTPGPNLGQFIVQGLVEYDARGLVVKNYQPRFTNQQLNIMDGIDLQTPFSQIGYDALGRAIRMTNSDGSYASVSFEPWMARMVDENGHMQKSYMDASGRLVKKEEYTGADGRSSDYAKTSYYTLYATTRYTYDAVGNLITVTDAHNNVTKINYDALGRKIGMNDPDMGRWEYEYDLNGNLTTQRNAINQKRKFSYDALNRLYLKTFVQSKSSLSFVNYTFDKKDDANGLGHLNAVTYGNDSSLFKYDELGRETKAVKTINQSNFNVSRNYDALNRIKELEYPDGSKIRNVYNQAGQIISIEDEKTGFKYINFITYNALGQMTQVDYGNGAVTKYIYHPLTRRPSQILTVKGSQKFQDLNYTYDAAGQIKTIKDLINTSSQTFFYDELNRLVKAVGAYETKTYAYDKIGNILLKDGISYSYGLNAGPHAVTSTSDGTTYAYNPNGNMVSKKTTKGFWSYVYDVQDRLMVVAYEPIGKERKKISEYYYDGDGGRTRKVVYRYIDPAYRNENTYSLVLSQLGTLYFGSNDFIKQETIYIGNHYELEDAVVQGEVQRKTKNIFLGNNRVASVTGDEVAFYHMNHLGSANVITDKEGKLRSLTEYDPFGQISRFERYGAKIKTGWEYFNDKPLDDETGLIFYGARYYDPKLGRFISADTIVQSHENPQTLNRYTYCNNNPVNNIDPSGHSWFKKFFKKVLTIGIGIYLGIATSGIGMPFFTGLFGNSVAAGIASAATSGAIAGAVSGAVGASLTGQDVFKSALVGAGFGALSAGIFKGINSIGGDGWSWGVGLGRVALSSLAGGGISKLAGGSFNKGALFSGIISGADFIYRAIVSTQPQGDNVGSSMRTAEENARPKMRPDGSAVTLLWDRNVSNVGMASIPGDTSWGNFLFGETGPVLNFIGKNIPGTQGLSLVHDIACEYFVNTFGQTFDSLFLNIETMPPFYGLNLVGSAINDSPGMIGFYQKFYGP